MSRLRLWLGSSVLLIGAALQKGEFGLVLTGLMVAESFALIGLIAHGVIRGDPSRLP